MASLVVTAVYLRGSKSQDTLNLTIVQLRARDLVEVD